MNELDKLAVKYGADKSPAFKHSYTPFYYDLLKNDLLDFKKVLEIGIGNGASLRMWRDFFPNATVYGIDIESNQMFVENRIETFVCDQSSREDLAALISKIGTDINLIIDDGSHNPDHQVFTCLTLMPMLNKHVLYIIEDVLNPAIVDQLSAYDVHIPNYHRYRRRYDDRLVIVRNKGVA